jgi:hypothetical protein
VKPQLVASNFLSLWLKSHNRTSFNRHREIGGKDPPHIAPIDGKEYADKRGLNAKVAEKGNAATSGVAKAAKPSSSGTGRNLSLFFETAV